MPSRRILLICLFTLFISACGGNSNVPHVAPIVVTVTLRSELPSIQINQSTQMLATVIGTVNPSVTYSVDGGSINGSIDTSGLYRAPDHAGTFSVRATSVADPSKSGSATISVTLLPAITINPTSATIMPSASVALSSNTAATFSVVGGAINGSLIANGLSNATYTAPGVAGTYQIIATANADSSKTASAIITVTAERDFRVNGSARIAPTSTTQFTALLKNQVINANWQIEGDCGTCSINSDGLFTAGATNATVTVRGTNRADLTQTATFQLTVASEVILTLSAPTAPSLMTVDMLTFNANISPEGINREVNWSTGPNGNSGSVIVVDYFRGYLPPATPGTYTITASSVADPSKTALIPVLVSAAPDTALIATSGAPSSMRYAHATATMPDGRILMLAGHQDRQAYHPLLNTDLFNPVSNNFSAGPDLILPRIQPEAIALDANRILVTGGEQDYTNSRDSAEVINLSTNTTVSTGNNMSVRRIHHRLIKLSSGPNNGKILVFGGFNGPVPYGVPTWLATDSVDVFDPINNTFSAATANMKTARGLFTATPLIDGRILIVGGYQPDPGAGTLASAEIYNPLTGTFSFTGSMVVARVGHTATRLADGRVLIVGGDRDASTHSSAEIYDPATDQFSVVASPVTVTRSYHAAALLLDGRVIIVGGESGESLVRGTVEVFDPATQIFTQFARMSIARVRASATPITSGPMTGKVLIFGGGAFNAPAKTAELTP